jgi:hypothetical protein
MRTSPPLPDPEPTGSNDLAEDAKSDLSAPALRRLGSKVRTRPNRRVVRIVPLPLQTDTPTTTASLGGDAA